MATSPWSIFLAVIVTFIGTIAAVLIKLGSEAFSFKPLMLIKNYRLLIGLFLYVVSSILFILALKGGELSVLYPILAIGYIWISLVSIKFLHEKMTLSKWIGVMFIIIGVSMIGIS